MAFTGRTEDGRTVSYVDGKRHLYILSLFLPMVPTLSVIGYLLTGNVLMTLVPLLFVFGVVPFADAILGEDTNNPPDEVVDAMAADNYYRILCILSVPLFWISFVSTALLVGTQELPW